MALRVDEDKFFIQFRAVFDQAAERRSFARLMDVGQVLSGDGGDGSNLGLLQLTERAISGIANLRIFGHGEPHQDVAAAADEFAVSGRHRLGERFDDLHAHLRQFQCGLLAIDKAIGVEASDPVVWSFLFGRRVLRQRGAGGAEGREKDQDQGGSRSSPAGRDLEEHRIRARVKPS